MKILFLILDGLADRPQAALGAKTPLEAATTPHLDRLAELGTVGLLIPLAPGIPLESETSHFLLFGYPLEKFPGRAAFEAAGRGIEIPEGAVVLLASFASVVAGQDGVRREAVLRQERAEENEDHCCLLAEEIASYEAHGIRLVFQYCGHCEGILKLSGEVSRFVTDSDPFYDGAFIAQVQPLAEAPDRERAERTAEILNEYLSWVYHRLEDRPLNRQRKSAGLRPINFLLSKWAAIRPDVLPFHEQNGMRAASVEDYSLYIGLARILGMTPVTVAKGEAWATDMREKLAVADRLFEEGYDFIHVHSKGPDVAAHRKDPAEKVRSLEELDSALAPVVEQVEKNRDLLVVITGDHATPSSGPLIHSGESVPVLIAGGPNVLRDDVREFHERAAVHGGLGRVFGRELMPILLNLTDRVRLYGVRHSPRDLPYWPREVKPFRV